MAVATSMQEFVRTHRGLGREDAYRLFREDERVRSAVERSPRLASHLADEFDRAWRAYAGAPDGEPTGATVAAGVATFESDGIWARAPQSAALLAEVGGARYYCPGCGRSSLEPRFEAGVGAAYCAACGWHTANPLELIPIEETGAFEYVFGDGSSRFVSPLLYAGGLGAAYAALRWLRL